MGCIKLEAGTWQLKKLHFFAFCYGKIREFSDLVCTYTDSEIFTYKPVYILQPEHVR